jgi:pyrroline-5-carboxylate reductase
MAAKTEPLQNVGFIGGGNMGFALAKAVSGRFPDSRIHVCDPRSERVELFQRELPRVQAAAGPSETAEAAGVVFVAVKPQDIEGVLDGIRETDRLLISIAAGVAIGRIEGLCPQARVVRVMPNTPCLVGAMAAGYAFGSRIRPEDRELVEQLLGAAGYAAEVEEQLLDAVTGLSGSGPAFVARLIEAFIEAGKRLGLTPEVTRNLALQTFYGTAKLLADTGMEPQQLVEMVSSPKGTTVAGRQVLEASAYAEVIGETIRAAAERSKELGR